MDRWTLCALGALAVGVGSLASALLLMRTRSRTEITDFDRTPPAPAPPSTVVPDGTIRCFAPEPTPADSFSYSITSKVVSSDDEEDDDPSCVRFKKAVKVGDTATMTKAWESCQPLLTNQLPIAARAGRRNVVAWLLDHGADLHANEEGGDAPVLLADAHPEVVSLLISRGAHRPSLRQACSGAAPNTVARLLAQGASPNPKTGDSLIYTLFRGKGSPANRRLVFDRLIAAGANLDRADEDGISSNLGAAVSGCQDEPKETPTERGCLPLVRLFLRRTTVRSDDLAETFPIPEPLRTTVLDTLLTGKLAPDAVQASARSLSGARDAPLVRKLRAHGLFFSATRSGDVRQPSPLEVAVRKKDWPLVRAMVDAGAPQDKAPPEAFLER